MTSVRFVTATTEEHAEILVKMVVELATFEKLADQVDVGPKQLTEDIKNGKVHGIILYEDDKAAAMIIYFYAYSSWHGKYVHLEDIFVRPEFRKRGYGKLLWAELGKICKENNAPRLKWFVLDWNQNAIDFYKTMPVDVTSYGHSLLYCLDGENIDVLANSV